MSTSHRRGPTPSAGLAVLLFSLILPACRAPTETAQVGILQLAVESVPSDVACLQIVVSDGSRAINRKIGVQPGVPATSTQPGLPVGEVSVVIDAFNSSCAGVTSFSVPTWVSGETKVTLVASTPTALNVQMSRPGIITVGVSFGPMDGPPVLALSGRRDFGLQALLAAPGADFDVTNISTGSVGPVEVKLSSDFPPEFTVLVDHCTGTILDPGQRCGVHVIFRPITVGAKRASLQILSASGRGLSEELTGTAADPTALVLASGESNFGVSLVSSGGFTHPFSVRNSSAVPTGWLEVKLPTGAPHFIVENNQCMGRVLGPGESCQFNVSFFPRAIGRLTALLQVLSASGGGITVNLTGTGGDLRALVLAQGASEFGIVAIAELTETHRFVVKDASMLGTGPLEVVLFTADPPEFALANNGCRGPLAPGGSCEFQVVFRPTTKGRKTAFVRVGCASAGPIDLNLTGTGGDPWALVLAQGDPDFGLVPIADGEIVRTFTVKDMSSLGAGPVEVRLTTESPPPFTVRNDQCTGRILAASGSCDFQVVFSPLKMGRKTALLEVLSGSSPARITANLAGTGGDPFALVLAQGEPNFGVHGLGAGPVHSFSIRNGSALAAGPLMATFVWGNQFVLKDDFCTSKTLQPGASCEVQVAFLPTSVGPTNGTLRINNFSGGSLDINLTGAAADPAALVLSPREFDFGTLPLLGAAVQTFVVSNSSGVSAGPVQARLTADSSNQFSVQSDLCTGKILAAGGTCQVQIGFSPTSGGRKNGTLEVLNATGNTVSASLTGQAAEPVTLVLSPATFDFGRRAVSSSIGQSFVLSNSSVVNAGPVTVRLTSVEPNQFRLGPDLCSGKTLAPGATCQVDVVFSPSSGGNKSGALELAASGKTVTATLTGLGSTSVSVLLEAESGTTTTPLQKPSDATASGGKYLAVAAGNNSSAAAPTGGRATYDFSVSVVGTYKMWGRVIAPSTADDSFWVSMDGQPFIKWNDIFQRAGGTTWSWDDLRNSDAGNAVVTFSLATGTHRLVVAYREDGAKLDQILITNDLVTPVR